MRMQSEPSAIDTVSIKHQFTKVCFNLLKAPWDKGFDFFTIKALRNEPGGAKIKITKEYAMTEQEIKKLGEMIKDIKIAMMTTIDRDGSLRSRPMATQQVEFDGDLWFFSDDDSAKIAEIMRYPRVNLVYSSPENQRYVSVSGSIEVIHDMKKKEELWSPIYKAWFPKGLEDPNLCLLKVSVTKAEYWDSPSSTVAHLLGLAKATVTGKPYTGGEHEKVH